MLGAKIDLIATYRSRATGTTTYGAYLVVRRSDVPSQGKDAPPLARVRAFLQQRSAQGSPARFVYHDRFSTSSSFLPSLYFRRQRVFAGKPDDMEKDISAIKVEHLGVSTSEELVTAVAEGRADVASVSDGARSKFVPASDPTLGPIASKVWFIRLQANLPDDLLVATRNARAAAEAIRAKLTPQDGGSPYPPGSDVQGWVLWSHNDAEDARTALSELRRQAAGSTLPVVVDVRSASADAASADEVEAVRQAVRLAGTELVATCESSDYKKVDVVWELAQTHDGAVRMTVRYDHFRYTPTGQDVTQEFEISFTGLPDLTRRVSGLINSRMHRIRSVWLYWDTVPTVIRDVAFESTSPLPFQEILWKNPRHNDYTVLGQDVAPLEKSDFNKLELAKAAFSDLAFEPMGRRAFRVLLVRPNRERPLFQALTAGFLALLGLAALGLVWDARREWLRSSASAERPEREEAVTAPVQMPDPHAGALTGPA